MPPRHPLTASVRVRILAAMLVVTAAQMTIAGGTAFLVQRKRVLSRVDQGPEDTASRLGSIAAEKACPSVCALLTAAIQQITPDTNEGLLGIIDAKSAVVPGSQVGVSLETARGMGYRLRWLIPSPWPGGVCCYWCPPVSPDPPVMCAEPSFSLSSPERCSAPYRPGRGW